MITITKNGNEVSTEDIVLSDMIIQQIVSAIDK